jgi:hypothetical protein
VNPYFGKVENNIPYRQTCAFSLWRIKVLNSLLLDGENAWEFEKIGVRRGFEFDGFYSTSRNSFKTINLVVKGKIVPNELHKIHKHFPELIFDRPSMSILYYLGSKFVSRLKILILNHMPSRILSKIYFNYLNR